MPGFKSGNFDVGGTCAHILARDVLSGKALDQFTVSVKDVFALLYSVVADYDRLSSSKREPGERVLVRHGAGESKSISDRFFLSAVVPKASATDRRTQHGAMDHDDAMIASCFIYTDHYALIGIYLFFTNLHFK